MAKFQTKGSKKGERLISGGLICLIIGIVLVVALRKDMKAGFMKPYDIYAEDADAKDIKKGDAVSTEIYAVLDTFGTLETTRKTNGAVTSRSYSYFYIIPVFDEYETYYIAVKVSSDDRSVFERIADDTWDFLNGERDDFTKTPFAYSGNINKLSDEAYDYMLEWFQDANWFGTTDLDEIKEYVWPLCLEPLSFSTVRVMGIIAILLIVIGAALFVLYFVTGKKRKEEQAQGASGTGYDGTINIAGVKYMKSDFASVNDYIMAGDIENAVKAVRDRTALSEEEARTIIDNWSIYYR